jgi:hypothetical protein
VFGKETNGIAERKRYAAAFRALLEGASGAVEKDAARKAPEVGAETLRHLLGKIGKLAVANSSSPESSSPGAGRRVAPLLRTGFGFGRAHRGTVGLVGGFEVGG